MKHTKAIVHSAIASLLTVGALGFSELAAAADKPQGEKCYGLAKAGKNDCQTASSACAGTNKQDGNLTAFIYVPKGTCDKIVGGSLTPKQNFLACLIKSKT